MKAWEPIDSAPRDGTHFWGKLGGLQARKTWWGKASHVAMHGWCYLEKPGDVESCSLWDPEHWKPLKKRKPPKNQRAYKTPSGKKARMVVVPHDEAETIIDSESIAVPSLVKFRSGTGVAYMARSDHMQKWRASQTTSTGEQ